MAAFGGGQPSAEQQGEWDAARAVFDRFAAADSYLFSVPMWNAGSWRVSATTPAAPPAATCGCWTGRSGSGARRAVNGW